jgi:hypothetical protein
MRLHEAIALCKQAEGLYDEDCNRLPILPWCEYDSAIRSIHRRNYVTVVDIVTQEWHDTMVDQGEPAERIRDRLLARDRIAPIGHLVNDAVNSTRWQALTPQELAELNEKPWYEIPHCR